MALTITAFVITLKRNHVWDKAKDKVMAMATAKVGVTAMGKARDKGKDKGKVRVKVRVRVRVRAEGLVLLKQTMTAPAATGRLRQARRMHEVRESQE